MTVCTVHEPPEPPADRIDRAESMIFLKDGFTWSAFLFGPIWLLANKLWLAALVYVGLVVAAGFALQAAGANEGWTGLLLLGLNAIVAWEAHSLKTSKLEADGWSMLGSVSGRGVTDCERRFFDGWLPSQPLLRRGTQTACVPRDATTRPPVSTHIAAAATDNSKTDTGNASPASRGKAVAKRKFGFFRRKD